MENLRILLIDDEIELTEPLSRLLSKEGYQVDTANDGKSGSYLASTGEYDLLILDWMLPEITGLEICQQLRHQGKTTPVLFLTAKDTVDDRVLGLDAGADDYLVKPFELRELLARVRALLRRATSLHSEATPEDALKIGNLQVGELELDSNNQIAYRQGRAIELSEKETQLLAYFMSYPGQLLTHQQIYQYLWKDGEPPSSNVLAALIRLLRRKIEFTGETPLINTIYGKGYRFGSVVNPTS
ncbi:two-component system response regulator RppA [Merismopedia glauca]|uniref:DNA-binding response regulator n=1 Tax=Merismopedia glauca CCAP 1448/3 TaxID=1296344 RepID=A0A2T1C4H5_9CYAN|nr:two-component system response regulator RppA [Merismopedia glauca]PSB03058.1 DNA-binding response regulator [Merismopedia glauca CCAP 1448/3]